MLWENRNLVCTFVDILSISIQFNSGHMKWLFYLIPLPVAYKDNGWGAATGARLQRVSERPSQDDSGSGGDPGSGA